MTNPLTHTTRACAALAGSILLAAVVSCTSPGPQTMALDPSISVNGEPVLGAYAVQGIEGLEIAHSTGMNVVLGGHDMLDTTTQVGRFCYDNGIQVMYHLTSQIYGRPRLRSWIQPTDTEIPLRVERFKPLPESGIVQIEDELIHYSAWNDSMLLGCERGYQSTEPAAHREHIILFLPEECAKEVEHVKDSPNLWGYYTLDDSPGDALSALRGAYSVVKELALEKPVIAGFGSAGSLTNLDTGVCDVMLIYWYPVGNHGYDSTMTSHQVQWMLTEARKRVPGIPFVGVYQTFAGGNNGTGIPTPSQVREQIEDYVREGASGIVSFCMCDGISAMHGLALVPEHQQVVSDIHAEIRETGGLKVRPQPQWMRDARIQPVGAWETPNDVPGVVPAWYLAGPFDDTSVPDLSTGSDLDATFAGKYGETRWTQHPSNGGVIGLGEIYGGQVPAVTVWARTTLVSPEEQTVRAYIGTDDDGTIYLNGEVVYSFEGGRGLNRDEDSVEVTLPAGESELLLRSHNRVGMSGFFVRFTDLNDKPLDNLTFDTMD